MRRWIATAELDGHAPSTMLPRLTSRDAAVLKRHPDVATHEVAFATGGMRFLA